MNKKPLLEIGGVARAHGIHGEVAIVTHDPDSETLGRVESIVIGGVERKIVEARNTHRGWLVLLDGILTRNDAEALRGQAVEVPREALELAEDDVLLHERADRAGGLAAAADHLAEIVLGNLELVDVRGALLDQRDVNLVGPIDQVDREEPDQLREVRRIGHQAWALAAARAFLRTTVASVPEGCAPCLIQCSYLSLSSLSTLVRGSYVPSNSMNLPSRAIRLSAATMR